MPFLSFTRYHQLPPSHVARNLSQLIGLNNAPNRGKMLISLVKKLISFIWCILQLQTVVSARGIDLDHEYNSLYTTV